MVELLIVVLLLAWGWGLPLVAVVSAARIEGDAWLEAERSKAGTIVGILLSCGLGAIYYYVSIRPAVLAAGADLDASRPPGTRW